MKDDKRLKRKVRNSYIVSTVSIMLVLFLLAIGFAVILLGFVLMAGGGSDSPDQFNYAMFSWRRITLAPILVIGGFVIEIYAILKRYK